MANFASETFVSLAHFQHILLSCVGEPTTGSIGQIEQIDWDCHANEFDVSSTTNILADRLEKLVEAELVERYVVMEEIQRDAYRLTDKGKSLHTIVELMVTWGLEHISGTEARLRPADSKKT